MKRLIEGWYHRIGKHCASTAISDALNFWGVKVSEAFCFGLGRGIGAFYLNNKDWSPSKWLMTRGPDLELRFFAAVGIPFSWNTAPDAETAWKDNKSMIDEGVPVLLQTDLHFLDYYNTKTHFNRHAVLLWGYDEEKGVGYLSDTNWEDLVEIPLDSLSKARSSAYPPGPVHFDWFPIRKPDGLGDLKSTALGAIRQNARELSETPPDLPIKFGLAALKAVAEDLPNWKEASDWSWSARFAYQAIEKRGTGGSAFRSMYADFIREAEDMAPEIKPLGLSALMDRIAAKWSEFAARLKAVSEQKEPRGLGDAQRTAGELHDLETEYCSAVLAGISAEK